MAFFTLGCKLNSYETESLREVFYQHRYDIVDSDQPADYYVINTCAVTGHAEADARQLIRSLTKRNPSARVILTGCYAQRDAQTLAAMPEVALVIGNAEKTQLFQLVEDSLGKPDVGEKVFTSHPFKGRPTERFSFGAGGDAIPSALHSPATIKVQDGCDDFLRCIIPHLRGRVSVGPLPPSSSMPALLCCWRYAEIDLTGVHTGAYGMDLATPTTCWRCSSNLCEWTGSSAFD